MSFPSLFSSYYTKQSSKKQRGGGKGLRVVNCWGICLVQVEVGGNGLELGQAIAQGSRS